MKEKGQVLPPAYTGGVLRINIDMRYSFSFYIVSFSVSCSVDFRAVVLAALYRCDVDIV